MKAHLIIYVSDQKKSAEFYRATLMMNPTLDVPGMTEWNYTFG